MIPQDIKDKIKTIVSEKYSEKNESFIHNRYLDYCCGYSLSRLKRDEQEARIKELEEFIEQFLPNPYPEDIFTPLTAKQLQDIHYLILNTFKIPLDLVAAQIGRELRKPLTAKVKQLLTNK